MRSSSARSQARYSIDPRALSVAARLAAVSAVLALRAMPMTR